MSAKITSINNEPVKDEAHVNQVKKAAESNPDRDAENQPEENPKTSGSHLTWEKPTKDEMKQLNLAMAWKFIRLLLQSLAVFVNMSLMTVLRYLDLPLSAIVGLALMSALGLAIYYLEYRAPLTFGERYSPVNDLKDNSQIGFDIGICVLLLAPFFYMAAYFWGFICFIPAAIIPILIYRQELFMLMLFVLRKYTVKDGNITWRRKYREQYKSGSYGGKSWSWTSLYYQLDFEDAAERYIPVLVDYYTFSKFKTNGKALLIYYRYGRDSYMFEIIRLKG